MALTLDATVGGAAANTYITIANATAYLEGRVGAEAWTGATDIERGPALVTATRRLDAERWEGIRSTDEQALDWPREGVLQPGFPSDIEVSGVEVELIGDTDPYYPDDEIPGPIRDATCELALAYLAAGGDPLADTGLEGFESVAVGSLEVTPNAAREADALPAVVQRIVRHLLASSGGGVRLRRA